MDALPPPRSLRRRISLGLVLLIAALFAYVFVHGLFNWMRVGGPFPALLVLNGLTGFVLASLLIREARKQMKHEL